MSAASIVVSSLAIILSLHSLIWSASAQWEFETASAWRTDPSRARSRNASPPWYVRYAEWLDDRLPGGGTR